MLFKRLYPAILLACAIAAPAADARPVSYPDAWTLMIKNDRYDNSIHAHYTFDTIHSIGARIKYDRDDDYVLTGAQVNRLIKRWNKLDSQANIYGRIALGAAFDETSGPLKRKDDLGLFLGASAD